MKYLNKISLTTAGKAGVLYVTDDAAAAEQLRSDGEAVLIYLHPGNTDQDFSGFLFAVEEPEDLEPVYIERVYRRLKGMPWNILETERCLIRETTPGDVDDFYRIYSDPEITEYMEGLYPEAEREKEYVREYIEKVYTFYGFGVWTVVERESGEIIGRAGISYREGFEEPELGFLIGVHWQRKGYAAEVCRAILAYAREVLEFERIQVLVESGNFPSLKLCEKLGFRFSAEVTLNGKPYLRLLLRLHADTDEKSPDV